MKGTDTDGDWLRYNVTAWWADLIPESFSHRALVLYTTNRIARLLVDVQSYLAFVPNLSPCAVRRSALTSALLCIRDVDQWAASLEEKPGYLSINGRHCDEYGATKMWISAMHLELARIPWVWEMSCEGESVIEFIRVDTLDTVTRMLGPWPWIVDSAALATREGVPAQVPPWSLTARGDNHVVASLLERVGREAVYVEIGVDKGDLTHFLLTAFPRLRAFGVDPYHDIYAGVPSAQRFDKMGSSEYYEMAASKYREFGERARLLRQESLEAARSWTFGLIDVVFIDAEHDFQSCLDDILAWSPLVRPGGFVAGDDYGSSAVGVVRAVHQALPDGTTLHIAPHGIWWWSKPIRNVTSH